MEQTSIWKRMRRFVGRRKGARTQTKASPSDLQHVRTPHGSQERSGGSIGLARNTTRGNMSSDIDKPDSSKVVLDLIDSIQRHQKEQERRASQIAESVTSLADTLGSIKSQGENQAQVLTRIADEISAANSRNDGWQSQIEALANAHRDHLQHVRQQMEDTAQREGDFVASLGDFRNAVSSLTDATTSSGVAIKGLQMSSLESEERIAELLEKQNQRFMRLYYVTLAVLAAGIVVAVVAFLV